MTHTLSTQIAVFLLAVGHSPVICHDNLSELSGLAVVVLAGSVPATLTGQSRNTHTHTHTALYGGALQDVSMYIMRINTLAPFTVV